MNSSSRPPDRDQIKEQLVPPGAGSAPPRSGRRTALLTVSLIFFLLVGGAIGVLVFLPGSRQETPIPSADQQVVAPEPKSPAAVSLEPPLTETPKPEPAVTTPPQTGPAEGARQAREQAYALKIQAEAENADSWAAEQYGQIAARLEEADVLLTQQAWEQADGYYRAVLADLQDLLDSREQRYQQALEQGLQRLETGQPDEAIEFFDLALLIKPSSAEAKNGRLQADRLAATITAYQQALTLEEQGDAGQAMSLLEEIIGSGSTYEPALQARQRIQQQLDEELFQRQMNSFFAALDAEDFAEARRSLQALESLGLRRQEVEQAAALLAKSQTRAEIERLKSQAETFAGREQWQQAVEAYGAILDLDPNLLFATAGRREAATRAELDRSMNDAVGRPQRLQDGGQRSAAASLLDYARRIEPRGPKLQGQIEALEEQLEQFRTPVAVTLESDNQTQVTIYQVGRISPFFTTEIRLKPGTYTLVGSRTGFRDVRMQITVSPDGGDQRYDIRCEEPI